MLPKFQYSRLDTSYNSVDSADYDYTYDMRKMYNMSTTLKFRCLPYCFIYTPLSQWGGLEQVYINCVKLLVYIYNYLHFFFKHQLTGQSGGLCRKNKCQLLWCAGWRCACARNCLVIWCERLPAHQRGTVACWPISEQGTADSDSLMTLNTEKC